MSSTSGQPVAEPSRRGFIGTADATNAHYYGCLLQAARMAAAAGQPQGALDLIRQVWGLMLPENTPYYSGGCWEYIAQTGQFDDFPVTPCCSPGLAAGNPASDPGGCSRVRPSRLASAAGFAAGRLWGFCGDLEDRGWRLRHLHASLPAFPHP